MNVYIECLVDELLKLWADIKMYDICKPIREKKFKFRGILLWTIHDSPGLTHFCGMYNVTSRSGALRPLIL
jgi:hypothetical protein